MNTHKHILPSLVICLTAASGCTTTHNIDRVTTEDFNKEETIVFVRPDKYSILGTRSLSDYIEIAYERATPSESGMLEIDIGIRNRGGQHFWDLVGPNFSLSIQTVCYDRKISEGGIPLYQSNWQTLRMLRGATTHYKSSCINESTKHYQVTISD